MSSSSGGSSSSVGVLGMVFILFLALKLIGVEPVSSWSWWLVTAPLWIGWGTVLLIVIVVATIQMVKMRSHRHG